MKIIYSIYKYFAIRKIQNNSHCSLFRHLTLYRLIICNYTAILYTYIYIYICGNNINNTINNSNNNNNNHHLSPVWSSFRKKYSKEMQLKNFKKKIIICGQAYSNDWCGCGVWGLLVVCGVWCVGCDVWYVGCGVYGVWNVLCLL